MSKRYYGEGEGKGEWCDVMVEMFERKEFIEEYQTYTNGYTQAMSLAGNAQSSYLTSSSSSTSYFTSLTNMITSKSILSSASSSLSSSSSSLTSSLSAVEMLGEFLDKQLRTQDQSKGGYGYASITSYLITPIQRLPRYMMFFDSLKKVTSSSHPDLPHLLHAHSSLLSITHQINKQKGVFDQIYHLQEIYNQFDESDQNEIKEITDPIRDLIAEGQMKEGKEKNAKVRNLLLFPDLLLCYSKGTSEDPLYHLEWKIDLLLSSFSFFPSLPSNLDKDNINNNINDKNDKINDNINNSNDDNNKVEEEDKRIEIKTKKKITVYPFTLEENHTLRAVDDNHDWDGGGGGGKYSEGGGGGGRGGGKYSEGGGGGGKYSIEYWISKFMLSSQLAKQNIFYLSSSSSFTDLSQQLLEEVSESGMFYEWDMIEYAIGDVIRHQGKRSKHLMLIHSGSCSISLLLPPPLIIDNNNIDNDFDQDCNIDNDKKKGERKEGERKEVGRIEAGNFIGEMTYLSDDWNNEISSASVIASSDKSSFSPYSCLSNTICLLLLLFNIII